MIHRFDTSFLRLLLQGVAVGALLGAMALLALAAGAALLAAMIVVPITIGFIMARQRLTAIWPLAKARRIAPQG